MRDQPTLAGSGGADQRQLQRVGQRGSVAVIVDTKGIQCFQEVGSYKILPVVEADLRAHVLANYMCHGKTHARCGLVSV